MEGITSSIKLAFLFALVGSALCVAPIGYEANLRHHSHRHHHQRHRHCGPTLAPPPPSPLAPPAVNVPTVSPTVSSPPPMEAQAPPPGSGSGMPGALPPGYELTPYQVHACGHPCTGSNDCHWPCMACCANSTCCDM